jgi:hypothetical protein
MKWHQFVLAALMTTVLSIDPDIETVAQQIDPTSWIEIWTQLWAQDPPPAGGTVPGGSRGDDFCQISPGKTEKIWSDRPLFLLTKGIGGGPIDRIELRSDRQDPKTTIWTASEADELIAEDENGRPIYIYTTSYNGEQTLEPGKNYHWLLFLSGAGENDYTSFTSFEVMSPEERAPITAYLKKLTERLIAEEADAEAIALERARYFAYKNMWADALQETYSVADPSEELLQLRETLPVQLARTRCRILP